VKSLGWSELSLIPVHGDYHQFNCRFEGDQVAGIVDFDNTRLEPRLYDVAYAINDMLGMDWRREPDDKFLWSRSRLLEPAALKKWLRAYNRYAPPLSKEEIKLLPLVCAVVWPETIHAFYPRISEEVEDCNNVIKVIENLLAV
jgi:Ser/Thr protein kinase RdoA (MazF antagonist)